MEREEVFSCSVGPEFAPFAWMATKIFQNAIKYARDQICKGKAQMFPQKFSATIFRNSRNLSNLRKQQLGSKSCTLLNSKFDHEELIRTLAKLRSENLAVWKGLRHYKRSVCGATSIAFYRQTYHKNWNDLVTSSEFCVANIKHQRACKNDCVIYIYISCIN